MKDKEKRVLITAREVHQAISSRTGLDQDNVKKVFDAYAEIYELSILRKCNLILPHIGKFEFDVKPRKPAGTMMGGFKTIDETVRTSKNVPLKEYYRKPIENDIKGYFRSTFRVNKSVQDRVRKITEDVV